ncbi:MULTISPECIES: hypothetical protein [Bradyrhizobium]|uniref:Uncharacterized protein n=2 Tax=Bradyrhizobium TaxID=374 RepID=A0ABY0QF92_9BRAD|nr:MULTISPECIES: hypothetical protein [Bradyrhizobium]SDK14711.1 hypothetical protein SAMN05444163_7357 [Bradyrhizobium ottawaense]SEE50604.1 hypothetical protein SAMN05444171_7774 [Bradyrhizobium lablabi]
MTDDDFEKFETADEILGYVFSQLGPDALQKVLEQVIGGVDREYLDRAASELRVAGLEQAADMTLEAATEALPERESLCTYEPGTLDYQAWQDAYDRRKRKGWIST